MRLDSVSLSLPDLRVDRALSKTEQAQISRNVQRAFEGLPVGRESVREREGDLFNLISEGMQSLKSPVAKKVSIKGR